MQCDLVLQRAAQVVPGVLVQKFCFKHPRQIGRLLLEVRNWSAEEIESLIAGIQKDRSRGPKSKSK